VFGIGLEEAALAFLFILVVLGANRLPEIGRSLSDAMREFRKREGSVEWLDADVEDEEELR
jgi:Sec-independent protein translocase protein TatA